MKEPCLGRILAISSQVIRGAVGLSASVPALQLFGHEVWALPTILLSHRPGLGRLERLVPAPSDLAAMLNALEAEGCFGRIDGVLTGYFPSPESVEVIAGAITRIRAASPDMCLLCDPVLGDGGRLYIPRETAEAIRDLLLPVADAATPNRFELEWLSGGEAKDASAIAAMARALGPEIVAVTSAGQVGDALSTVFFAGGRSATHESRFRPGVPNGTGDVLAGLLLGAMVVPGADPLDAFDRAMATLDVVIDASDGADVLRLPQLA